MVRRILNAILFGSFLTVSLVSWGSSRGHSVLPAFFSNGGYGQEVVLSGTSGGMSFSGGNTSLGLQGIYGYFIVPRVEVALEVNFLNSTGGGTNLGVFVDGIYNFEDAYSEAYFAFGGFGLNSYSGKSNSSSSSAMKFGVGKRLPMWGAVSLMPKFWLQKEGSGDMVTNIYPLAFSIIF